MRRAITGLLRVASQLLGRSDGTSAAVLRTLQLLPKLHPDIAWDLAEPMAAQVLLVLPPLLIIA